VPAKYHIESKRVPPRFRPVGELGIVDWREDCAGCHNCVKRGCVFGFFRDEAKALHDQVGYLDYIYQCKGCLSCVQNCTKGILERVVNPEYERLGDAYYTPEMVLSTWYQAETGAIPVSGAGYGGPFSGQGFDSMWTDMSEIVRPTRDGIHGREYINTGVDIGRKPGHLVLKDGRPAPAPTLVESPLPLLLDVIPERFQRGAVLEAVTQAAAVLGTFAVVCAQDLPRVAHVAAAHARGTDAHGAGHAAPAQARSALAPLLSESQADATAAAAEAALVMVPDASDVISVIARLKQQNAERVVAVRMPATPKAAQRVLDLAREGTEAVHLVFDAHGREQIQGQARHARDVLREVHGGLVKAGIRDEITLIASGGIALPEHMAKAIICGADLVAVDLPLIVALECRLCGGCERDEGCPVRLDEAALGPSVQRIVNLISAWRNQLIEMLGAMGIREVRRLRGETGRSMFFEDLERATFGKLFGRRKQEFGA
jgi:ferredoxin